MMNSTHTSNPQIEFDCFCADDIELMLTQLEKNVAKTDKALIKLRNKKCTYCPEDKKISQWFKLWNLII